ncbi:putative trans-aconitate 2-methyltransferase [Burkholderiales bacterium]|nr:putative trans-aconitate 2-methyltransferase [Burkholderiales bacterium]
MSWDPQQYLEFEDHRLRPAIDLLARVPLAAPRTVVDLGCGTGYVTRLLAKRWPDAGIVGIDNSEPMLAKARAACAGLPRVALELRDLAAWTPAAPVDLVFSNAALHWLPDHASLLPRVAGAVAAGGALAVQMPGNFGAPSHTAVADIASSERWRVRLGSAVREAPVASPEQYLRWLAPHCASVDVWETSYLQRLSAREDGEHPVVSFVSGTWLVPFLERLEGDAGARTAFLGDYRERIARAYPAERDGSTLFPFRRVFIVATMRS